MYVFVFVIIVRARVVPDPFFYRRLCEENITAN